MIHTRICDLLGIPHPIVLGGMGTATTAPREMSTMRRCRSAKTPA